MCVVLPNAKMVKLHLRLRPGERRCATERGRIVVLVGQIDNLFARGGGHGPECDTNRGTTRDLDATAQAEYRIEYSASSIGQRPAIGDCRGVLDGLASAEEPGAVSFELHISRAFTLHDGQVRSPHLRIIGRTLPPGRQYGTQIGNKRGLNEHLCLKRPDVAMSSASCRASATSA